MIVNPQLFNYRLIIGSLVIVILILGGYSYNSVDSLKKHKVFIQQEKQLLENELSEMIDDYKTVNVSNNSAQFKLENATESLNRILDSIKVTPADASLITQYKAKLFKLKRENVKNTRTIALLESENASLRSFASENDIALLASSELVNSSAKQSNLVTILNTTNNLKSSAITSTNSKSIGVTRVKAAAVRKITAKNRIVNTDLAIKAKQMSVSFTIPKDKLMDSGDKMIYIQILDPNNNIVGDQGSVYFGKRSLIYSKKMLINYTNENFKVETLIKTNHKEPLVKGHYLVNIFHNDKRVGNTSIYLN